MSLGPLHILFGEESIQVLCPFFNWVVFLSGVELCDFFMYFGDQTLVKGIIGKYVFSYCWLHFHFADVFFGWAEAFYFDEVPFVYVPCSKGHIGENILICEISEIFPPRFSSRTLMVLQLIFKFFIHLEFIFVCGVSWWLSFIILHVAVQISQHHLLKRLFLLHFMLLPPLPYTDWPQRHGFISGLFILFHWSMFLFLCQYNAVLITLAV